VGAGVAAGGNTGQFLKKNSTTNYDTSWSTVAGAVYQPSAPSSPQNGDIWIDSDAAASVINTNDFLLKADFNLQSTPIGGVTQYAGATSPSTSWAICDGAAVSRTTYATLFARIGTTYGIGDNSTTFNLPNLKGRVVVGVDAAQTEFNALGETGGAKTHTLTTAEIPAHSHPNALSSNTVASSSHRHDFAIALLDNNYAAVGPNGAMNATGTGQAGAYRYSNSTFTGAAASTAFSVIVPTPGSTTTANATRMISYGDTNTPSATTTVGITNADNTGGGGAHNNLQPYIAMNYLIRIA
jgi:microcystin-dependent protein